MIGLALLALVVSGIVTGVSLGFDWGELKLNPQASYTDAIDTPGQAAEATCVWVLVKVFRFIFSILVITFLLYLSPARAWVEKDPLIKRIPSKAEWIAVNITQGFDPKCWLLMEWEVRDDLYLFPFSGSPDHGKYIVWNSAGEYSGYMPDNALVRVWQGDPNWLIGRVQGRANPTGSWWETNIGSPKPLNHETPDGCGFSQYLNTKMEVIQ